MSLFRAFLLWLHVLILVCWPTLAQGVDSLAVGMGSRQRPWAKIWESSRLISVNNDSIWLWDVEPGGNLVRGTEERGGGVRFITGESEDGAVLYDGDKSTALDPDSFAGVDRTTPLFVSLGGTFRVNRIRFFPRLDHVNKHRFLQEFRVLTRSGTDDSFSPVFSFLPSNPNVEPVVDRRFASRDVCYLRLEPTANREWEIAELEIYGDGTVPEGEFVSKVQGILGRTPLWGKVRFDEGDITRAPVVIQTRTGPDPDPVFYFLQKGDELVQVDMATWSTAVEGLKVPPRPNPEWSAWENVDEGVVRSPSLREHIQFRVRMSEPGACLKRLVFEYSYPPLARDLAAELNPIVVEGGQDTEFTLSMEVHLKTRGSLWNPADSGFRQLQVLTTAETHAVERVLVDDREVSFSFTRDPGRGFTVNLWRRVVQNGSFVQVVFRGTVFRDRTRFEVRALDRRRTERGIETAYQLAREADVEPVSAGGSLTVGLVTEEEKLPLIIRVAASSAFTPNGDGVNDEFRLAYTLLKLVRPVPVFVEIYDLSGRQVRQAFAGEETIGSHGHGWDGRDENREMVGPGLYVYEVRVEADEGTERRRGVVGVVY